MLHEILGGSRDKANYFNSEDKNYLQTIWVPYLGTQVVVHNSVQDKLDTGLDREQVVAESTEQQDRTVLEQDMTDPELDMRTVEQDMRTVELDTRTVEQDMMIVAEGRLHFHLLLHVQCTHTGTNTHCTYSDLVC